MRERVVITGPTGAVGMALLQLYVERQSEVLLICHKGSKRNEQIPQSPLIRIIEVDLDDLDTIDHSFDMGYNIFYHLAWNGTYGHSRNQMELQIRNIQSTVRAAELAARMGCHTFIGAGSQAEYGRTEGMLGADTPAFPENGYGMAKLCAGQMSRVVCRQRGMRHIWVRILSVYGPYDRGETLVSSSLVRMIRGEETFFTAGDQIWDFLYSGDAAAALFLLGRDGRDGAVYCLGSGVGMPLREYILKMKELTSCEAAVHFGALSYAQGQVMYLCADIEALKRDIGFTPQISFEAGICKTVEWIKKNEKNKCSNTLL